MSSEPEEGSVQKQTRKRSSSHEEAFEYERASKRYHNDPSSSDLKKSEIRCDPSSSDLKKSEIRCDPSSSDLKKSEIRCDPSSSDLSDKRFNLQPQEQLWSTAAVKPGDKLFVKWFIETDDEEEQEEQTSKDKEEKEEQTSKDRRTQLKRQQPHNDDVSSVKDSRENRRTVVWWKGEIAGLPLIKEQQQHDDQQQPSSDDQSTLLNQPTFESDKQGRFIWMVHYEPVGSFQAENCRTVFLDRFNILHPDYDGNQALQFSILPPEKSEEENNSPRAEEDQVRDDEQHDDGDAVITLQEIIDAQRLIDEEEGDSQYPSLESSMDRAFNSLPHEMKIEIALKYRSFADSCETFLRQLVEEKGPDHAITVQEIREFLRDQQSCPL